MSSAPQAVEPSARGRDLRRLFADNPVVVLTFVFVGLFVATDLVNRFQSSEAFLTPKQVSTTVLYAAILGLMAAGQTLLMLTGGVDLSVATTALAYDAFDRATALRPDAPGLLFRRAQLRLALAESGERPDPGLRETTAASLHNRSS